MNFTDVVTAREVLTEALTALRTLGEGLAFVQEADLGDLAREASQMTALARGLLTATTMEAEARGLLVTSGSGNIAQWLLDHEAATPEVERNTIARAVRETRRRELAPLRDAMASGEVSPGDAITAARTFDDLRLATDPAMHPDIVDAVIELAQVGFNRSSLRRFRTEMLARFGTARDEDHELDKATRRGVTGWHELPDGTWRFEATYDTPDKVVLDALFNALGAPLPQSDGMPDLSTPGQRRADALVQAAQLVARMGTTGPTGTDARVNLILPIESLTHATGEGATAGSDERGTPLMPATARLLSCCATVTPIWVDTDGRPLHVGRSARLATAEQRRALEVLDGGCTFPGCTALPSWTQAHHIVHWADGGQTNLDNLASLCGPHHRFIHQHHITGHVDSTAPRGGRRVRWHVMRVGFGWRPAPPPEPDEAVA